jgi:Uma2 family endonuclease
MHTLDDLEEALAENVDLTALWNELNDPTMRERYGLTEEDRYELTEHGEVVLTPRPTFWHQALIAAVMGQITDQLGGVALPEAPIRTRIGVRCPDVVWMPADRRAELRTAGPLQDAPPLVVEVLSPSNSKAEIAYKMLGYLGSGVSEVVIVARNGKITYCRTDGEHAHSVFGLQLALAPNLLTDN